MGNRGRENMGNYYIHYVVIIVVCFFAFFVNNRIIPADLMESRNLATAQEMVRTGNYLVPTMNGDLRLEKPPLPTWVAAGIENVFPGSLVAQRCAAGVMATCMVIFLYLLASQITRNRKIGFIASLVLASCFNVILMGRTATWDIYCHSFMLGAIYFLFRAFEEKGSQWKYFIFAGIFMGLSALSKGPVSYYALFLPFLISYIAIFRPRIKGKVWPLLAMIVVCVVISFWWTTYIFTFHQDVALSIAHKESSSWLDHNVRPLYYYWQFPGEAGIWALFLVVSLIYFFVSKRKEYRKEYKFSIVWFLASLILLSLVPEKKPRYLLPILIPGAMVIAFYLYYGVKMIMTKGEKVTFRINALLIALLFIALPIALYIIFYREGQFSLLLLILTTVLSWGLSFFILISIFNKTGILVMNVLASIVLGMILIESVCLLPIGKMFINSERHSIRVLRSNSEIKHLPFYYNQNEELRMELVYEANQILKKMDVADTSFIYKNTPFVFVSGKPIDEVFAGKRVKIEKIDTFDNNWRKTGHKRYNKDLVREVAIIKKLDNNNEQNEGL